MAITGLIENNPPSKEATILWSFILIVVALFFLLINSFIGTIISISSILLLVISIKNTAGYREASFLNTETGLFWVDYSNFGQRIKPKTIYRLADYDHIEVEYQKGPTKIYIANKQERIYIGCSSNSKETIQDISEKTALPFRPKRIILQIPIQPIIEPPKYE